MALDIDLNTLLTPRDKDLVERILEGKSFISMFHEDDEYSEYLFKFKEKWYRYSGLGRRIDDWLVEWDEEITVRSIIGDIWSGRCTIDDTFFKYFPTKEKSVCTVRTRSFVDEEKLLCLFYLTPTGDILVRRTGENWKKCSEEDALSLFMRYRDHNSKFRSRNLSEEESSEIENHMKKMV